MSRTADFQNLGLLPLRCHDTKGPFWTRSVVYAATIEDREKASGKYEFEEHSTGDLVCALHFRNASGRDIPGWAFAWPVVVRGKREAAAGASGGGSRSRDPNRRRAAGFSFVGAPATFESTVGYNATFTLTKPPQAGGSAASVDRNASQDEVETVSPYKVPDFEYGPVLGGKGYPADSGFSTRLQKGPELPAGFPGFPKGYYGLAMAGTATAEERPVMLSGDPRLIAVNKAGLPEHSTVVVDTDSDGAIDPKRSSPIHSAWRVIYRPSGAKPMGPRNPIAWNLLGGGRDATAGYGLTYDTIEDPRGDKPAPVTTKGEGRTSGGGSTQGTKQITVNANGRSFLETMVAQAFASVQGAVGAALAVAKSSRPASGAGAGVGATSHRAFGPFTVGSKRDKHQLGHTADGEPIVSNHIHTDAYFFNKGDENADDYDAPLEFQTRKYPNPGVHPYYAKVHLVMDHARTHPSSRGSRKGLWRWYSEIDVYTPPSTPMPPDPPPPTTPPTGGPEDPPTTPGDPPPVDNRIPQIPLIVPHFGRLLAGVSGGGSGGLLVNANAPTARPPKDVTDTPAGGGGADLPVPAHFRHAAGLALIAERGAQTYDPRLGQAPMALHELERPRRIPSVAKVRTRENHDAPQSYVRATAEHAYPALLFIPQSLSPVDEDLRRYPGHPSSVVKRSELAPVVLRAEAWGGMRAGEWELNQTDGRGKYRRIGPGGLYFMSPKADLSDAATDYAPTGVTHGEGYIAVGRNVHFAAALPNLVTGGMHTGYRWGCGTTGALTFEWLNSSGVALSSFGGNASGAFFVRETGGPTVLTLGAAADGSYLKRTGSAIVGSQPVSLLTFATTNVAAGVTAQAVNPVGITGGYLTLDRACTLVGISFFINGTHTTGTIKVRVRKNGSPDSTLLYTSGATATSGQTTGTGVTFAAGDTIGCEVDTSGGWNGTTGEVNLALSLLPT